jgi:hypothetical protein
MQLIHSLPALLKGAGVGTMDGNPGQTPPARVKRQGSSVSGLETILQWIRSLEISNNGVIPAH